MCTSLTTNWGLAFIGTAKRGLENRESRSHSIKEKVSRIEFQSCIIFSLYLSKLVLIRYKQYLQQGLLELKNVRVIAPFIPVKIENSTCEIFSAALGTLFLCCVRVVNQNTRALLLLVFCYSYAT